MRYDICQKLSLIGVLMLFWRLVSSTANRIRRQKQTKKIAKYRKKAKRKENRQATALIVAHHYNKKFNRFVFGNKRK